VVEIIAFVVVISVMIFAHEAGHLVAAKAAGVRVLRFSFGFGKVLASFTWRGTQYAVSLIPLGGYVKMAGGEESEGTGAPDEFLSRPRWVRMLIYLAGPAMNVVLAVLLYAVVAKVGFTVVTGPSRIAEVVPTLEVEGKAVPSPASRAGFRPGDVVIAVNGKPAPYWYDMTRVVYASPGKPVAFDLKRDGRPVRLTATPVLDAELGIGVLGLIMYQDNRVFYVDKKGAAAAAGVVAGDTLATLDGRPVPSFNAFLGAVRDLPPGAHTVTFAGRGGEKRVVIRGGGAVEEVARVLGVGCGLVSVKRTSSWAGMLPAGCRETWETAGHIVRGIAWVIKGKVKVTRALGGPVSMALYAGETARIGVASFLSFMAALSTMLAMLNLLPVPLMDGGQVAITAVEAVRRRELSPAARGVLTYVGLAVIGMLLVLALFGDANLVVRRLHGGW